MGSYFTDKWDALMALPSAIADNPVFFAIVFLIAAPLIWWKWRVMGGAVQQTVDGMTHGLRTDADTKQARHDIGIGTKEVLVMRPAPLGKMIYFALFFFGGGALFYVFIHMSSDRSTPSDWWTALGLLGFAIISMVAIEINQTRIYVGDATIQRRRVLHRRQTIAFKDIVAVDQFGKSYARGLIIRTNTGEKMRVLAGFSGYRQLMQRLTPYQPKLGMLAKLAGKAAHA